MAARTWSGSTGATLDTGVATASATLERHPVAADLPSATGSILPRLLSQTSAAVGYPVAGEPNLIWRRRGLVRGPLENPGLRDPKAEGVQGGAQWQTFKRASCDAASR